MPVAILLAFLQVIDTSGPDRLYASGRFADAAAEYRRLLKSAPENPELLLRLGASAFALGSLLESESAFRKSLEISPASSQALLGLGTTLVAAGKPEDAIAPLEKGRKLAPGNLEMERALGRAYQEANRLLDGEPLLRSLVKRNPKDWESWYALGALLFENNYYQPALEALETSLKLNGTNSQAAIYRAGSLAQLGRAEEAEKAFAKLLADPRTQSNPEFLLGYAQFLFEAGRYQDALVQIENALAILPGAAKLHFWKARVLFALDKPESAATSARRAIELAPDAPNARHLLLRIARSTGDAAESGAQVTWLENYERSRAKREAR